MLKTETEEVGPGTFATGLNHKSVCTGVRGPGSGFEDKGETCHTWQYTDCSTEISEFHIHCW